MAELLLEIGCEELPAPWLADLGAQLASRLTEEAAREHLEPRDVQSHWTPRRLVAAAAVRERQGDRETVVWGPSLKVARDPAGAWSKAALGFAKKNGVAPEALQQVAKDPAAPEELYLQHLRQEAGRPAVEVLPDVIAATLRGLAFPKRMNWDAWLEDGKGAFPFGRPIRWLVALLDGAIVPFAIHEMVAAARGPVAVESGAQSFGHRFLPRATAGRPLRVGSFAELRERLRKACVILEPDARARLIREALPAGADLDSGLVQEWRDLVEHPAVVTGRVPAEFRRLPREVLETVLVHHQKYLPLADADGIVSGFAAVTNTDGSAAEAMVRGMERVVVARLRDAAFFFAEDRKRALAERFEDLAGVTFHQALGSYRDKAERLVALVDGLPAASLAAAERTAALEAARLAKADLTTLMVREFTELQGVMGGLYLAAEGRPAPVADAVRWHYHPIAVEAEAAPAGAFADAGATRIFAAASLADKLDTLAGYFGLGLVPTGSSDPFGLRRAAQGAVRVLVDFWPEDDGVSRPQLRPLLQAAVAGYGARLKRPAHEVLRDLESFLLARFEYLLQARGFAADEVAAVVATSAADALGDPRDALARVRALHEVRREAAEDFAHLAAAFKRVNNILKDGRPGPVDPGRFEQDAERGLDAAVGQLEGATGSYEERLRALTALRAPIDRFFDDVLVMAEDPAVRTNRLALLDRARALFYRIADISRLGG